MRAKRKSITGAGRGVMAYFDADTDTMHPQDAAIAARQPAAIHTQHQPAEELARATFYIRPDQHDVLEELRIRLRKHHVKTNKSELVRVAIDFLVEQDISVVIDKLSSM
jgi:hypothetical protein